RHVLRTCDTHRAHDSRLTNSRLTGISRTRQSLINLRTESAPNRVLRPILKYGDQTLHEPAGPVESVTPDIDRLVGDMIETMYAAPGIGLAAPQVGVPLRIFVVDVSIGRDPAGLIVMINPEFVEREGMQIEEEGCLS